MGAGPGQRVRAFPGAILMTTNCIQQPRETYKTGLMTGLVAWPGVKHIEAVNGKDFTPVIGGDQGWRI